ncbi:hypothetical protein ISF_03173 [Cordyceps fumosorosea ARSEF 2679]|uniref:Uncharacterized protein n=1 Tax=Cordyceps fumosorosea (strain ARSEF 2679) TaxID=1081104 RepID=A0A168BBT8_CORFA|nr:hypothetical protein ISF_03173 [Cordyceps fumosorosea ARSEF 2679]OAA69903.1 hypothetical protein ISF_03173 [Cordyceps fumosorosea ARSEF 2679]
MPDFILTVRSLTAPTLPAVPAGTPASAIRSPLIPGPLAATSPLRFVLSLPGATGRARNPLRPATHLQLAFLYPGSGEVYLPEPILPEHLVKTAGDDGEYEVEVGPDRIPRVKVNEGESPDAEVRLNAWRNEKLLGRFTVGVVEGLGVEGFKSSDLAKRRVEVQKAKAANEATP